MKNVKEVALNIIKNMPDNCSFEDIQYELYAKEKIESGLLDLKNGATLSEAEMDIEINSWQA